MRAVVAFALSVSMLGGACFPNNAKYRTYAKLGEGAAIVGGIAMLYAVNSGADCDMNSMPGGEPDDSCKTRATVLGDIGLGLILIGLIGFIATVSTSEDDTTKTAPVIEPKPILKPEPKPEPTPAPAPAPAPAPTDGAGAGSGSAS